LEILRGQDRVSVKPRKFIFINLKYSEYQRKPIDAWRELRTGEITINETKIIISFKKGVDLANPKDWIAIDVNESNITAVSSNPHILRIDHNLRTIHTTYFSIRRSIQKPAKPKTAKRLLKKYSSRGKRRAKELCRKISREIVDFTKQHSFGILMEDLNSIRNHIKYGRQTNRRLHS
jgi:putative transposase